MTGHRMFRFAALMLIVCAISMSASAQNSKQRVIDAHKNATARTADIQAVGERFQSWRQSNDVLARYPGLATVAKLGIDQILGYDRLLAEIPSLDVRWDSGNPVPIYITGNPLQRSMSMAGSGTIHDRTAQEFFRRFAPLLGLDGNGEGLKLAGASTDELGRTHLRFTQVRNALPVIGKEAICGITPSGDLDLYMGRLVADAVPATGSFSVSPETALTRAGAQIAPLRHSHDQQLAAGIPWDSSPSIERAYAEHGNVLRAVYAIELRPTPFDRWRCLVDATDGTVLSAFNAVCSDGPQKAQATDLQGQSRTIDTWLLSGTYFMIDATRPMFSPQSVFPDKSVGTIITLNANNSDLKNVTHVTSGNNSWSDASSVSAHRHAGIVYEYYRTTHNRNSLDNKGGNILSIVNVTQNGAPMENAFWNGQFISYGNGGSLFEPFAKALDMSAHEFTHGVTENSAGLEYKNQSGALNESFSDIFAVMVDRDDWTFAEDITRASQQFPNGTARSLEDPHNGGTPGVEAWQPKHMNEFQTMPESQDNGGVHINSGIPNHAAYLVAMQLGRDKTERIMYRALTTKLTSQARFIDFRLAIIRSAEELYGAPEAQACASACDQVGITDGSPTRKPGDLPPVDGLDRMLFVNTDLFLPATLWIVTPPGSSQNDFSSISFSGVWSRPSITDDGSIAVFIDDEFNLRAVTLTGTLNEVVLDNSGIWNSVAVSRDGNLLALTTILLAPELHVFDISGPTIVAHTFPLYTPTYSDTDIPNTAIFADAMEFSLDGSRLLFDLYNEINVGSISYGFWDINTMDIWNVKTKSYGTGRIDRVFPQDPEINIGNPVWAKTKQSVIAFDVQIPADDEAWVMAMDVLEGNPTPVAQIVSETFGYPTYSGGDNILSFVNSDAVDVIFNVPMANDAITPAGAPQGFISEATFPVWFRSGTRPVSVQPSAPTPEGIQLSQNYPNPFNPITMIRFTLEQRAHARLTVHDLLGRQVATLVDGVLDAGMHASTWTGKDQDGRALPSGVYMYRLSTGHTSVTRRMVLAK